VAERWWRAEARMTYTVGLCCGGVWRRVWRMWETKVSGGRVERENRDVSEAPDAVRVCRSAAAAARSGAREAWSAGARERERR
jgi:hypothetical protein